MKAKTVFFCTECGSESPKWSGRCTVCGAWNSMVEQATERPAKNGKISRPKEPVKVSRITEMQTDEEIRFSTGMGELDRVLGGGAVKGSLVLVGGAPGIGKSTLMLQICQQLGQFAKVLYVSGEESTRQLKLRAERLHVDSENLFVLSETRLGDVLECVAEEQPDILIVDSIQTLYNEELDSPAGGVGQVKDCTMALMQLAKGQGITVFVIGHVNKEGSIAGPKVLEHMVDCVLYFEGDRHMTYRILRAAKPLWCHQRDRRVRNAGRRAAGGGKSIGNAAVRPSGGCLRHLRHLRHGGGQARSGGGAGPDRPGQRLQPPAHEQRLRL